MSLPEKPALAWYVKPPSAARSTLAPPVVARVPGAAIEIASPSASESLPSTPGAATEKPTLPTVA